MAVAFFDSCNLHDMAHNINVPKVDNMSQATMYNEIQLRRIEMNEQNVQQLLFITIPFEASVGVNTLDGFAGGVVISRVI